MMDLSNIVKSNPGIGHNRPKLRKGAVRNGVIYQGFYCGLASWLFIVGCCDANGYERPVGNPIPGIGGWVVEREALTKQQWGFLHFRTDWILALTWFFATSGATTTLPSDFVGAGSTIYCIGAGEQGAFLAGGGGGACSYSAGTAYSANQVVNIKVGTGDTWFDTATTIKGAASVGVTGGLVSSGFGSTKVAGGNGRTVSTYGGGGAGGISAGNNAPSSTGGQGDGSIGGVGGTTGNPGANGTEFQVSPARGAGGGGGQGILCPMTNGGNGGLYGGGGGGGVTPCCPCTCTNFGGLAAQGLIAGSYTPTSASSIIAHMGGVLEKATNFRDDNFQAIEFFFGVRQDIGAPMRAGSTIKRDSNANVSSAALIKNDNTLSIEADLGVKQDYRINPETLILMRRDAAVEFENTGATSFAQNSFSNLENLSTIRDESSHSLEAIVILRDETPQPLEKLGIESKDVPSSVEMLLGSRSDKISPLEEVGTSLIKNENAVQIESLIKLTDENVHSAESLANTRKDSIVTLESLLSFKDDNLSLLESISNLKLENFDQLEALAASRIDSTRLNEVQTGVRRETSAVSDFLGSLRGDSGEPLEWTGTAILRNDGIVVVEFNTLLKNDNAGAIESGARFVRDSDSPLESLISNVAHVSVTQEFLSLSKVNAEAPLENTGTTSIRSDSLVQLEFAGAVVVRTDVAGQIETLGSSRLDRILTAEILGNIRSDARIINEFLGSVISDAKPSLEFLSSIRNDKVAQAEWLGRLVRDSLSNLEVTASAQSIQSNGAILLEHLLQTRRDAGTPMEFLGVTSTPLVADSGVGIEILASLRVANQYVLEFFKAFVNTAIISKSLVKQLRTNTKIQSTR